MEQGLTPQRVIAELTRSPHGELSAYAPIAKQAVAQDPAFFAHLIAWNHVHGQVRDAKLALPVLALQPSLLHEPVLVDNALAHLASLDPRNLLRALRFALAPQVVAPGLKRQLRRLVERYLYT